MRIMLWVSVAIAALASWGSPAIADTVDLGTWSAASAYYQSNSYYGYDESSGALSSSAAAQAEPYPDEPAQGWCGGAARVEADGSLHAGSTIMAQLSYPGRSETDTWLRNVTVDSSASRVLGYRVTSSDPLTTQVCVEATFNLHGTLAIEGFVGLGHKAETSVNVFARVWNSLNPGGGGEEESGDPWSIFLYGSGSVEQWYFDGLCTPKGLALDAELAISDDRYSYQIDTAITGSFNVAPDTDIAVEWNLMASTLVWEADIQMLLSEEGLLLESDFLNTGTYSLYAYDPEHPGAEITLTPIPEPATMSMLGLGLAGLAARRRRGK